MSHSQSASVVLIAQYSVRQCHAAEARQCWETPGINLVVQRVMQFQGMQGSDSSSLSYFPKLIFFFIPTNVFRTNSTGATTWVERVGFTPSNIQPMGVREFVPLTQRCSGPAVLEDTQAIPSSAQKVINCPGPIRVSHSSRVIYHVNCSLVPRTIKN